jgi:hypothetical protein
MHIAHDSYRHGTKQNVAYAVAGGASAQSTAFGSQTYWIRVCAVGVESASADGVRIAAGDNPTATSTSALLPLNWVEYLKVTPGQKIAVLGNNASTGNVSVIELTD